MQAIGATGQCVSKSRVALTAQFSIVSGVLPSAVSFIFGYLLPIIMRKISKYQGQQFSPRGPS